MKQVRRSRRPPLRVRARITSPIWVLRHLSGKARGLRILLVWKGRATPPDGMDRRPNRGSYSCTNPKPCLILNRIGRASKVNTLHLQQMVQPYIGTELHVLGGCPTLGIVSSCGWNRICLQWRNGRQSWVYVLARIFLEK